MTNTKMYAIINPQNIYERMFVMWKVILLFGLPMLIPFEIAYGVIMNVLGPLGLPDFLGIMTNM